MTEALHLRVHLGGPRSQHVRGSSVSQAASGSGSGLAELTVRMYLSIDFRGPTFYLSATVVIGSGMTSTSANNAEETMRRHQETSHHLNVT